MKNSVIITSAIRTAVGSLGKTLKNVESSELGAAVIKDLIDKLEIHKPAAIRDDTARKLSLFDNIIFNEMPEVKMIMQVHDELVFEAPLKKLDFVKSKVSNAMESAVKLSIPLLVDIGFGNNWNESH